MYNNMSQIQLYDQRFLRCPEWSEHYKTILNSTIKWASHTRKYSEKKDKFTHWFLKFISILSACLNKLPCHLKIKNVLDLDTNLITAFIMRQNYQCSIRNCIFMSSFPFFFSFWIGQLKCDTRHSFNY